MVLRAFVIPALLILLPLDFCASQEEDNSPEAGRERLAKIAQEINNKIEDEHKRGVERPVTMHPVSADALKESRGQTEDELRMYLLAFLPPGEKRDKTIQILNSPWGADTVKNLWELHTYKEIQQPYGQPYGGILDLLVYVATKYKKDVFAEVQRKMEDLFSKFCSPECDPNMGYNSRLLSYATNALERYGTSELLPNSFWRALEREEVGVSLLWVIAKLGEGADPLTRLGNFKKTCTWREERSLRVLEGDIELLQMEAESKKSQEREKGEGKPPQEPEPKQEKSAPKPEDEFLSKVSNILGGFQMRVEWRKQYRLGEDLMLKIITTNVSDKTLYWYVLHGVDQVWVTATDSEGKPVMKTDWWKQVEEEGTDVYRRSMTEIIVAYYAREIQRSEPGTSQSIM